jgi:hypothetical protein
MQRLANAMDAKSKPFDAATWLIENSAALHEHNAWIAVNGTFGDRLRAWKIRQSPNESQPQNQDIKNCKDTNEHD